MVGMPINPSRRAGRGVIDCFKVHFDPRRLVGDMPKRKYARQEADSEGTRVSGAYY